MLGEDFNDVSLLFKVIFFMVGVAESSDQFIRQDTKPLLVTHGGVLHDDKGSLHNLLEIRVVQDSILFQPE